MTFKIYHILSSLPKYAPEILAKTIDHLEIKLGEKLHHTKNCNGHLFVRVDASVSSAHILGFMSEIYPNPAPAILDLGDDLSSHSGLPKAVKELFVPLSLPAFLTTARKPDPFAGFIGIAPILDQFREVAASVINNRLSNRFLGTSIPDGFLNVLLVGPRGLGKTTLSKAVAELFRQEGVVAADAQITFMSAGKNVDEWIGHSEAALRKALKENENGILILDELDALLKSDSFGESVLTTLNTEMGNAPNRPIIIANCYGSSYNAIVSAGSGNEGLAGRFAHTAHLQPLSEEHLADIFFSKLAASGLLCDVSAVRPALAPLLRALKNKEGFANGRETDNILAATLRQRNQRLKGRMQKVWDAPERLSTQERQDFLTVQPEDIPHYDLQTRMLVPHPAPRTRAMSARVRQQPEGKSKVIRLRPE